MGYERERSLAQMDALKSRWANCQKCEIGKRAFKHVFGRGDWHRPHFLFIGEAPGKMEDIEGVPFVGLAGQLLDKALCRLKPVPRYYITNIVSCRPCDDIGMPNRAPMQSEVSNCRPRLETIVGIVQPLKIVLLGKIAQREVLELPWVRDFRVYCMEHPAWILRQGGEKSKQFRMFVKKLQEVQNL